MVVLLVVIGVGAAIGRAMFIDDFVHRAESIRLRLIDAPPHSEEDLAEVDNKFGNLRFTTLLHIIPGGLYLLLAPIQFIPAIRNRYLNAHRWLGRALLIAVLIGGAAGLFFGVFHPIGGVREAIGIVIFGTFLDSTRTLAADPREQFVVSIWSGWLITIAAAELWIRYRRRPIDAHRLALHHLQQEPGS